MLKIISKIVTGLVKEMGVRRVMKENETEGNQVGVLAMNTGFKMERQAMKLAGQARNMVERKSIELRVAGNMMKRMFVKLANEVSGLLGNKEMSVMKKEKNHKLMPNQAAGVNERIGQLLTLPINLLAEFKFALSLLSKKEVLGVNTS
ncbi:hypothetical protein M3936_23755 [Sutcliffiella horikoshii]|uniref:hypothetical protein n=1 Tax=Sutcliffiella horikoshii TaxID=79883 RepID=UPI0007D05CBF|nr:hypothetical protein [Sutcliffiella horikoshii]MCM3620570.1 hypothetical protein [Sutcliffiella horikoshii]